MKQIEGRCCIRLKLVNKTTCPSPRSTHSHSRSIPRPTSVSSDSLLGLYDFLHCTTPWLAM
ncbi:hypothetical protein E2C01_025946 [Portunus trituberculatus]|uniref:Uncharacterized protein n=1 Tax=Portunus trituberculatus TaxID=210409 RepID=A0A5B7EJC3_PORTR|nr:hypothetical protein [Portunus trituberculatus]